LRMRMLRFVQRTFVRTMKITYVRIVRWQNVLVGLNGVPGACWQKWVVKQSDMRMVLER